jgi:hypothetical protein
MPHLWYYPSIRLEGLRKIKEIEVRIMDLRAEILIR